MASDSLSHASHAVINDFTTQESPAVRHVSTIVTVLQPRDMRFSPSTAFTDLTHFYPDDGSSVASPFSHESGRVSPEHILTGSQNEGRGGCRRMCKADERGGKVSGTGTIITNS